MIQITAKGVALLDRVFEVVAETENEVLRCLAPSELLTLARIFDKLYAQLGESSVETLQPR
jgi:hypothetical protein